METAAPLWKSMGKVKGFSQFGCDERSLRSTLGWRGAHWEVFLSLAGPVNWAGWKDNGCVSLFGKATCWQGVGGTRYGHVFQPDGCALWALQAMGGEVGFLWPAPDSLPMSRGNLSENVGSWMGRLKDQSGRMTWPPRTRSRLRDRPRLEFVIWKTACFRESGIPAFEPCPSL